MEFNICDEDSPHWTVYNKKFQGQLQNKMRCVSLNRQCVAQPSCFYVRCWVLCRVLHLCRVSKNHFHAGGQARIGRPKVPVGSGSPEASPIIRYKDAVKARVSTMYVRERAFMDQITCKFVPSEPPSLKMMQPTPLERTVFFLRRFRTTHINFWRKERPKYRDQPVTGVPKVIDQILMFGKGKHLPRDEENVIVQGGLDGPEFPEGGSEGPTLEPEIDRLRRDKREKQAKKQAKHASQVLQKRQRTLDAFCVVEARADVASSSSSVPLPSQSSQPPVPLQSQPQPDSNQRGKEKVSSSQPKPPAKKPNKRKNLEAPRTFTEEEVAKMNKQMEDRILEMLYHMHDKSKGPHPLDPTIEGVKWWSARCGSTALKQQISYMGIDAASAEEFWLKYGHDDILPREPLFRFFFFMKHTPPHGCAHLLSGCTGE